MKFHEQVCWNFRQLRGCCSDMQWRAKSSSSFYLTLVFGLTLWFGRAVIVFFFFFYSHSKSDRTNLSSRKTNLLAFPHISIVIEVFFSRGPEPLSNAMNGEREWGSPLPTGRQPHMTDNKHTVCPSSFNVYVCVYVTMLVWTKLIQL